MMPDGGHPCVAVLRAESCPSRTLAPRPGGRADRYSVSQIHETSGPAVTGWLPFVDTYGTMCTAPEPDFKRVLEEIQRLSPAA